MRYTVLVVDDHPVISQVLTLMAPAEFEILTAGTQQDMLQYLQTTPLHAVVLDIDLHQSYNGVDLLPEVAARKIPVVVYSGIYDFPSLRACYAHGVRCIIEKRYSAEVLLAGVRAVIAGKKFIPDELYDNLFAGDKDKLPQLSQAQARLLELLYAQPYWSNAQLAQHLQIAEGTLRNRLVALYDKFAVRNKKTLLLDAKRRGFRIDARNPPKAPDGQQRG